METQEDLCACSAAPHWLRKSGEGPFHSLSGIIYQQILLVRESEHLRVYFKG